MEMCGGREVGLGFGDWTSVGSWPRERAAVGRLR